MATALDLRRRDSAIRPVDPACLLIVYLLLFPAKGMADSLVVGLVTESDFRLVSIVDFFVARFSPFAAAICPANFGPSSSTGFGIAPADSAVVAADPCRQSCFGIVIAAADPDFVRRRFVADFSSVVVAVEAAVSVFVSGAAAANSSRQC